MNLATMTCWGYYWILKVWPFIDFNTATVMLPSDTTVAVCSEVLLSGSIKNDMLYIVIYIYMIIYNTK